MFNLFKSNFVFFILVTILSLLSTFLFLFFLFLLFFKVKMLIILLSVLVSLSLFSNPYLVKMKQGIILVSAFTSLTSFVEAHPGGFLIVSSTSLIALAAFSFQLITENALLEEKIAEGNAAILKALRDNHKLKNLTIKRLEEITEANLELSHQNKVLMAKNNALVLENQTLDADFSWLKDSDEEYQNHVIPPKPLPQNSFTAILNLQKEYSCWEYNPQNAQNLKLPLRTDVNKLDENRMFFAFPSIVVKIYLGL